LLAKVSAPAAAPPVCGVNPTLTVTLLPAGIVTGKETPSKPNWELLLAAEVTVTGAPVALRIMDCVPVFPTVTLPKFSGAGAIDNCPPALEPVPVSGMVTPPFGKTMLPLAAPPAGGLKITLNVRVWFGVRSMGRLKPLVLNPLPVISTWVTRMYVAPELVTETGSVKVFPTGTLPNDKAAGFGVKDSLAEPTPPTPTCSVELVALLVNRIVPSTQATVVGVNVKSTFTLCPATNVSGRARPATPNTGEVELTAEMVTPLEPELVRLTVTVSVCWSSIVPNLTFLGLQLSW